MFIIKIGGSVITDKSKEDSFKKPLMDKLSQMIKKSNQDTIIIHGAGSYGHILAKKYDLNNGLKNDFQLVGFSKTHSKVQELNCLVIKSLNENGIPAVSVVPHNIMRLDNHKLLKMDCEIFNEYLQKGFTPVTFGDVVIDESLDFSICSGDLLIQVLSKYFKPEKTIFLIDEDGLYTSNPKKNPESEFLEKISLEDLQNLSTSLDDHADVTGGMTGKIKTIKNIVENGVETVLLNGNKPDRLYQVLIGEETHSTTIKSRR